MQWYIDVLKKYATFKGRARRKEYWMFVLFNLLFSIVLALIEALIGGVIKSDVSVLTTLYSLAVLIPSLAVSVRRLHDTNHSGFWLFIGLIPLIGAIWLLVYMATNSQPGENKYGPNPKEITGLNPITGSNR
jgi:uncharacterized membrane protein YhaH (DUF805 family)